MYLCVAQRKQLVEHPPNLKLYMDGSHRYQVVAHIGHQTGEQLQIYYL